LNSLFAPADHPPLFVEATISNLVMPELVPAMTSVDLANSISSLISRGRRPPMVSAGGGRYFACSAVAVAVGVAMYFAWK